MANLPRNAISSNNFNPNYMARIHGNNELGDNVDIRASLPENFNLNISAEWEPLINPANLPTNGAGTAGQLGRAFGLLTNSQFMNQALTQMVWLSTSPVEFNMPFLFDAISDAKKEVEDPVRDLMKLILPSVQAGGILLKVPGPGLSGALGTLTQGPNNILANIFGGGDSGIDMESLSQVTSEGGAFGSDYNLKLQIGKRLTFEKIIVKSVSPQFDSMFTKDGFLISAQVDVVFTTSQMLVKGDIDRIFGGGSSSTTPEAEARRVDTTPVN